MKTVPGDLGQPISPGQTDAVWSGQLPACLERLRILKSTLDLDPTNLDSANRYWEALSSVGGHNVRSAGFAIEAFRACALVSQQGTIAFCRAFCELNEHNGEKPRPELLDEELLGVLKMRLPELSIYDSSLAHWILRSIRKPR
jgi:hypothetical protein